MKEKEGRRRLRLNKVAKCGIRKNVKQSVWKNTSRERKTIKTGRRKLRIAKDKTKRRKGRKIEKFLLTIQIRMERRTMDQLREVRSSGRDG